MKELLLLFIPLFLYVIGGLFIKENDYDLLIKKNVLLNEYSMDDEQPHFIKPKIKGIGAVITYNTLYLSAIPLSILAMLLGGIIYNNWKVFENTNELEDVLFVNCIIGLLLIFTTSKPTIIPTIFYWCAIISGYIIITTKADK